MQAYKLYIPILESLPIIVIKMAKALTLKYFWTLTGTFIFFNIVGVIVQISPKGVTIANSLIDNLNTFNADNKNNIGKIIVIHNKILLTLMLIT